MWIAELVGRFLWTWHDPYATFVGAMVATGCNVAVILRTSHWLASRLHKSNLPSEQR